MSLEAVHNRIENLKYLIDREYQRQNFTYLVWVYRNCDLSTNLSDYIAEQVNRSIDVSEYLKENY